MHAEAELEGFIDNGGPRPIPKNNKWLDQNKDTGKYNYQYWYRLVRAYSGWGLTGTQIIKYIYAKRGEVVDAVIPVKLGDPFKPGPIKVEGVRWSSGSNDKFEHPTPNIKVLSDVTYHSTTSKYFFFKVPTPEDLSVPSDPTIPIPGAHETEIFIHGTRGSKGCFLLGGGNEGDPTNNDQETPEIKNAIYLWDIMMQLLNDQYETYVNKNNKNNKKRKIVIGKANEKVDVQKFENGIVKITSAVTKNNITGLDFNYEKLEATGKGNGGADKELTPKEKDYFDKPPARPLTPVETIIIGSYSNKD
ncbi:MAG: hypothetical protein FWF73_02415 [Spirochaetes bacterium]|nr:hypothetical protein [Spirochaetota bacterium]